MAQRVCKEHRPLSRVQPWIVCDDWPMHHDRDAAQISPTAHYTGQTWLHHGMSDPALATLLGLILFHGLRPLDRTLHVLGQPTVDGFLLARHRAIDAHLRSVIEDGSVTQIVEVACGLSPRGLRFHREYGDSILYVEADLPGMARLKRRQLREAGSLGEYHRVMEVDALADEGSDSLAELMATLDPHRGTAIITEGLINYFDQATAEAMFARFARALEPFPTGLFLTDLYLAGDNDHILVRLFSAGLAVFVRGRVHVFYSDENEVVRAMQEAGFGAATAERASDHPAAGKAGRDPAASMVRVVRAVI